MKKGNLNWKRMNDINSAALRSQKARFEPKPKK